MESKQGIHVMTLANSIIGVSILAMPYCFKQCGIILSIILLIFSSILSRLACHFLLKSAIKARLRTFEFLAYHVFGSLGKLFVEIGMIGFLIGTCIAFFVVMGDLSPQIVAHMAGVESTDTLRTAILIALGFFCVLPLGLLRNVDSLSVVCTATIGFYACLVLKIMGESASHILVGDWVDAVNYWRPAGILQCIPIFSMALFCQTQLFEIYQAIPNASLEKMNNLVRLAVNICTCVYIFVGVFGYIAISHEVNFTGNILMNFKPSIMTEVMKIGFVLSVAFSFPLVIFPCRASLYSLIYKPTYSALHESTSFYIPESKFRLLTFLIVLVSLIIGVLIPNIELVLGLVGSTIGVMICVLFPATCFICLTSKNTNERVLAQIMLFIGVIMMVLGTYANLYAMEQVAHGNNVEVINEIDLSKQKEKLLLTTFVNVIPPVLPEEVVINKEVRHEPPQPEAPLEEAENKKPESKQNTEDAQMKQILENGKIELQNIAPKPEPVETPNNTKPEDSNKIIPTTKKGEIDKEALKKEDKELEQVNYDRKLYEEHQKLLNQQKEILDELKKTHEKQLQLREEEKEEKVKAVRNIENLARLAIESLVEKDDKQKITGDSLKIDEANRKRTDDLNIVETGNKDEINKKNAESLIPKTAEVKQSNVEGVIEVKSNVEGAALNTGDQVGKASNLARNDLSVKETKPGISEADTLIKKLEKPESSIQQQAKNENSIRQNLDDFNEKNENSIRQNVDGFNEKNENSIRNDVEGLNDDIKQQQGEIPIKQAVEVLGAYNKKWRDENSNRQEENSNRQNENLNRKDENSNRQNENLNRKDENSNRQAVNDDKNKQQNDLIPNDDKNKQQNDLIQNDDKNKQRHDLTVNDVEKKQRDNLTGNQNKRDETVGEEIANVNRAEKPKILNKTSRSGFNQNDLRNMAPIPLALAQNQKIQNDTSGDLTKKQVEGEEIKNVDLKAGNVGVLNFLQQKIDASNHIEVNSLKSTNETNRNNVIDNPNGKVGVKEKNNSTGNVGNGNNVANKVSLADEGKPIENSRNLEGNAQKSSGKYETNIENNMKIAEGNNKVKNEGVNRIDNPVDGAGVEAKNKKGGSADLEGNDGKNRKPDDSKNKETEADKISNNHRDILSADNYLRRKRDVEENEVNSEDKHCGKEEKNNAFIPHRKTISDEVRK